ncbi:MAG: peptidoglycan DD-metalloendopeptidase family protein [Roseiflexaceae bacterium]
MHPLRYARRARGLTLIDLAVQSGISARVLGAYELGMSPLDTAAINQLALILDLPARLLIGPAAQPASNETMAWRSAAGAALIAAAVLAATPASQGSSLSLTVDAAPASEAAQLPSAASLTTITPTTVHTAVPTSAAESLPLAERQISTNVAALLARPAAASTAVPSLAPNPEPRGCPLLAAPERVVITQGYGVGTHAPAALAGAIDLAIDADGDGYAEPDSTSNTVVLASHSGVAKLYPNSWPGGNVVRIIDEQSGWNTLYAHLATIAIQDGQAITAGQPIGTIGSTGLSTGPHLHYEIWLRGENQDPTNFAPCWQNPLV